VEYSKWEIYIYILKKKRNNHEGNVKSTRVKNSPICNYTSCWEHVFSHQGFHTQDRASRLGIFKLLSLNLMVFITEKVMVHVLRTCFFISLLPEYNVPPRMGPSHPQGQTKMNWCHFHRMSKWNWSEQDTKINNFSYLQKSFPILAFGKRFQVSCWETR